MKKSFIIPTVLTLALLTSAATMANTARAQRNCTADIALNNVGDSGSQACVWQPNNDSYTQITVRLGANGTGNGEVNLSCHFTPSPMSDDKVVAVTMKKDLSANPPQPISTNYFIINAKYNDAISGQGEGNYLIYLDKQSSAIAVGDTITCTATWTS